jgi:hypothetical protein
MTSKESWQCQELKDSEFVLQDMPIPDAPELVALLQTVGFQLCNMGFSGKEKCVGRAPAALKVTIECGASGVVAELRAPAESPCRCTVFSSKEEPPQEQASFWTITTSQVFTHFLCRI